MSAAAALTPPGPDPTTMTSVMPWSERRRGRGGLRGAPARRRTPPQRSRAAPASACWRSAAGSRPQTPETSRGWRSSPGSCRADGHSAAGEPPPHRGCPRSTDGGGRSPRGPPHAAWETSSRSCDRPPRSVRGGLPAARVRGDSVRTGEPPRVAHAPRPPDRPLAAEQSTIRDGGKAARDRDRRRSYYGPLTVYVLLDVPP